MKKCLHERAPIRAERLARKRRRAAKAKRQLQHAVSRLRRAAAEQGRTSVFDRMRGLRFADEPRLNLSDEMMERMFGGPALPLDPMALGAPSAAYRFRGDR